MEAKYAKGNRIRVVKQFRDMLIPGEVYEINYVDTYGDAEGFLYRFTRIALVAGSNPDRYYYSCLREEKLTEYFELIPHDGSVQYLRNKLLGVQAMIQEYQAAERVRVGAAIAVAQNPQAKIIMADDASLLDSTSLKVLREVCRDFQIWMVVNDESGKQGVWIEDGGVREE